MNLNYIYSGTRAQTLATKLLTDTQLERLLGAKGSDEARKVLQDTFLAPYLSRHSKSLSSAVEASVSDAKHILASISPEPEILDILWIRYDFFNLRTIIKAERKKLSSEEIIERCYTAGIFPPEKLLKAYKENTLSRLRQLLAQASEQARKADNAFEIDLTTDLYYFTAIKEMVATCQDNFVHQYVRLLIDIFNLRTALRVLRTPEIIQRDVFVEGGVIIKKDLENEQSIFDSLVRLGGQKRWSEAIAEYRHNGTFVLIDKTAQEYMLSFLKEESRDIFSPAPLFAYFNAQKNNAQIIRAIVVAKDAGMPEAELRFILRRLYT